MTRWGTPAYVSLAAETELFHVHRTGRSATQFNPHTDGVPEWRFSPFASRDGALVGSWYGAPSAEGALYETVFRDVVTRRLVRIDSKTMLAGRVISRVSLTAPLELAKLYGDGLMKLRLPTSFTTGGPESYAASREVGGELHQQFTGLHGFIWQSRINNQELSVVLFGDRVPATFARTVATHPLDSGEGLALAMAAAGRIDCGIS